MRFVLLALAAASVFLAGCGGGGSSDTPVVPPSRLTTANFDAIQNGMSKVQLIQLLGRWQEEVPDAPAKGVTAPSQRLHCRWKKEAKQIDVVFEGDKVVSKSSSGLSAGPAP